MLVLMRSLRRTDASSQKPSFLEKLGFSAQIAADALLLCFYLR